MEIQKGKSIKVILVLCVITCFAIPGIFTLYYWLNNLPLGFNLVFWEVIFNILITFTIATTNTLTTYYMHEKFPWDKGLKLKRLIIELIITNINASIIITIFTSILYHFFKTDHPAYQNYGSILFSGIIVAIVANSIIMLIIESYFLIKAWIKSKLELEQLKREKAESQYAALRNQVNPHFLFNSLNTLSSLIRTSPEKAIDFVDRFSKIYRYVLDVNDKIVVELKDEMNFLQSYYFLQKIRFGENLIIETHLNAESLKRFILPLSLQIVIENAIKHNEVSSERPLQIRIEINGNYLTIKNNLQLKHSLEPSNGIGLQNIKERYSHISDIIPEFIVENDEYIARLPLLNDNE